MVDDSLLVGCQLLTIDGGGSKRFIYPIKEIIKVNIFSTKNLLSIKKEGFIPLSLDRLSIIMYSRF